MKNLLALALGASVMAVGIFLTVSAQSPQGLRSSGLTRPIFCTSASERVISQSGAVKLVLRLRQGYRACVKTALASHV